MLPIELSGMVDAELELEVSVVVNVAEEPWTIFSAASEDDGYALLRLAVDVVDWVAEPWLVCIA